ncbi:MAG: carbohydrate-binding domain-containing protein [Clostridiaceae bacterium]|nr:carbohydrate-binding domain-containing protein [Clostridiaceae bacterium]
MKLKIASIILTVLLITYFGVACVQTESSNKITILPSTDTTAADDPVTSLTDPLTSISDSDMITSWSDSDTKISLNGSSASVSGSGATANGSVVTITEEGSYVASGTLSDGQIVIAAANTDKVHLVLNGVDIVSKSSAPVYASQCDKLAITLADGTKNSLTDGGSGFLYADPVEEEPNAALFCKDDLTINGTGSLIVNASFNNGIVSKDDLMIISGEITVSAANHGIKGNDSITLLSGVLDITASNDGINSNGNIIISGGDLTISVGDDGIHADGNLTVNAGTIIVNESYEGLEAANIIITGGEIDLTSSDDALNAAGDAEETGGGIFGKNDFSTAGAYSINISGGNIILSAGGDGIDSNGTISISGGNIQAIINSSPDNGALDADGEISFTGGTIIYGGTGVGSAPGNKSTQSYVFLNSGIISGTEITVQMNGQTLIAFTPSSNLQYLALSSPDILSGESYDIYSGNNRISTVIGGEGGNGMMNGGPGGAAAPGGRDFPGGKERPEG